MEKFLEEFYRFLICKDNKKLFYTNKVLKLRDILNVYIICT